MMSSKNFAGKENFQRMNYLYQISELLIEKSTQNSDKTDKKCLNYVSNYYSSLMINIGKKSQQRIDSSIKRIVCKGCERLLIPGTTARVRFRQKPQKHNRWTCLQCGSYRVFNMNKNYILWSENPKAIVEKIECNKEDANKVQKK